MTGTHAETSVRKLWGATGALVLVAVMAASQATAPVQFFIGASAGASAHAGNGTYCPMGGNGPCYHDCSGSFSYSATGQGDVTAGPYEADGSGYVGGGLAWASASPGASLVPAHASGSQASSAGAALTAHAESHAEASSTVMLILGAPATVYANAYASATCTPYADPPSGNSTGNGTNPPPHGGSDHGSDCSINDGTSLTLQATDLKLMGKMFKYVEVVAPPTELVAAAPITKTTWFYSGTNPVTHASLNAKWVDKNPTFSCLLSDYVLFTQMPEGSTYISDLSLAITIAPGLASIQTVDLAQA